MSRAPLCLIVLVVCASSVSAQRRAWSEHVPALEAVRALESSEPRARRDAVATLARRGDDETARAAMLEALSTERDASVRRALGEALEARPHPANVEKIAEALRTASPVDAPALAAALAAVGTAAAGQALVDALVGRDDLRGPVMAAIRSMGVVATPALMARLRDEPTFLPAIELLAGDVEALPMLSRLAVGANASSSTVPPSSDDAEVAPPPSASAGPARVGLPPSVRLAALSAIARSGDARARAVALRATEDPVEAVAEAGWNALASVGWPADASLLAARVDGTEGAARGRLLRQIMVLDVHVAEPLLRADVTSDDPDRVRAAADLVLSSPHEAWLPILHGLIREGSRAEEAADALAEVEGGAGVGVLSSELSSSAREEILFALAITARRWTLSRRDREHVLEVLRAAPAERGRWLRAIAQDGAIMPALLEELEHPEPSRRALAAHALALLASPEARPALVAALAAEDDVDAWRVEAVALSQLGGTLAPAPLLAALADDSRAAEAALLVTPDSSLSRRHADRRDRALRKLLRGPDPRARAHAALALGRLRQHEAWRALLDVAVDPTPAVRRAAATALARLSLSPTARTAVARQARRTQEPSLRRLFERAASGLPYEPPRGREVLRARVVTDSVVDLRAEVVLSDGRTLRLPVPSSGEIVVGDLPSQVADIQLRAGRAEVSP